jgi:ribosome-binding factor A
VDRVQIEVRDEMGRIIQQDQLKGGVGYIPLSTVQMKRGVYLCSVFFDGIHVSTEKIIKL